MLYQYSHILSLATMLSRSTFIMALSDEIRRLIKVLDILLINPIRSGLFQTANDPVGGGDFKSPAPPPTISKTILSIFTISYMCILPGVLGMFQLEFFKNSRFSLFYSHFKIKSSENSCKNNIFVILFKIDFKYTKRRGILMRI